MAYNATLFFKFDVYGTIIKGIKNFKCNKKMGNYTLYQTKKGVKILVKNSANANVFDIDCPFKSLLENDIERIGCFDAVADDSDSTGKNSLDKLLTLLKPDVLLGDYNGKFTACTMDSDKIKLLNIEGTTCVCFGNEKSDIQKYYTLFLVIDQIKSIKSKLDLG